MHVVGRHQSVCLRVVAALLLLSGCVTTGSESAAYWYFLGEEGRDRPERALEMYERALAVDPGYTMALFRMGEVWWYELRDHDAALSSFHRAVEVDPGFGPAYISAAYLLMELDREGDASEMVDRAIETIPDFAEAYKIRIHMRIRSGDHDGAFEDFELALPNAEGRVKAALLVDRGRLRRELEDLDGAMGDFLEAAEVDPGFAGAYIEIGWERLRRGHPEWAEDAFREAMVAARDGHWVRSDYSRFLLETGRPAEAMELAEDLVVMDPENPESRALRGRAFLALGHYADALHDLNYALERIDWSPWLYLERGRALYHLGRYEACLDDLHRGGDELEYNPFFLALRGDVHMRLGMEDAAWEDLHRALEMEGDHPYVRVQLAYHFLLRDNHGAALEMLMHPAMRERELFHFILDYLRSYEEAASMLEDFVRSQPELLRSLPDDILELL